MKWTRSRTASALALGAASALLLSACQSDKADDKKDPTDAPVAPPSADADAVTITFAFWGNFGLESLVADYMKENENVIIELQSGEYNAVHDNLAQQLLSGSGAPTITGIDEGYMAGLIAQSDDFVNLLDLGAGKYKDRYLPWKWAQATNADESVLIGLGSDVGGLALCYRWDLFEEAGMPTERDEVAAAMGDTWEGFIEFGKQYQAAQEALGNTDKKFVDNASNILNPLLGQNGVAYYNRNNELDMDAVKSSFDTTLAVVEAGLSANIPPWSPEWNAGFTEGTFAVLGCPAWMKGHLVQNAPEVAGKWDITDIPGPGGNWGGAFYAIPNQGTEEQQRAAYEFLEWLIDGPQQIRIFQETGNLPSQHVLYDHPRIKGFVAKDPATDYFREGTPIGEIYTQSAKDIPSAIYYAPKNATIRNVVEGVINEVQAGQTSVADAWAKAVEAAEAADASA